MALPAFIYLDTLGKGMATDYLKIPLQLGPELATRPIVIRFSSSFIKRRNRQCALLLRYLFLLSAMKEQNGRVADRGRG